MKPFFSFLATLCLFLNASAQESPINKSTDQTTKGIRIGQPVPDVLVTGAIRFNHRRQRSFRIPPLRAPRQTRHPRFLGNLVRPLPQDGPVHRQPAKNLR
jgi:predicted membrane metal-binding protein